MYIRTICNEKHKLFTNKCNYGKSLRIFSALLNTAISIPKIFSPTRHQTEKEKRTCGIHTISNCHELRLNVILRFASPPLSIPPANFRASKTKVCVQANQIVAL